jgi:predicted nucleic acid-binding protein
MSGSAASDRVVYLDSSAFVKLVVPEAESAALRRRLRKWPRRASSGLLRVEAVRAVRPSGPAAVRTARRQMARLHIVEVNRPLLDAAANLAPPLRSLDAIHLAAAQSLGDDLEVVITYDQRMAAAARVLGMVTAAPA